jgi:hypothetical protein
MITKYDVKKIKEANIIADVSVNLTFIERLKFLLSGRMDDIYITLTKLFELEVIR